MSVWSLELYVLKRSLLSASVYRFVSQCHQSAEVVSVSIQLLNVSMIISVLEVKSGQTVTNALKTGISLTPSQQF